MRELADEYEESAACLSGRVAHFGHSVAILSVLALEVRLKCALLIECGYRPRGHNYRKLWQALFQPTREKILADAMENHPNYDDKGDTILEYGDINVILERLRQVFEKGRYSYEFIDNLTPEEMKAKGEIWIANGARSEEADLAFYPQQRDGLNLGLKSWLEESSRVSH